MLVAYKKAIRRTHNFFQNIMDMLGALSMPIGKKWFLTLTSGMRIFFVTLMFLVLCCTRANSQNIFSIPGGDGIWGNTGNWSATSGGADCSCIPAAGDNVFIEGAAVAITLNASPGINFNSLTIQELADGDNPSLTIGTVGTSLVIDNGASGGDLNIIDVPGGSASPYLTMNNSASLSIRGSVIINDGDNAQANITLNSTSTLKIGVDLDLSAGGTVLFNSNTTVDYYGTGAQSVLNAIYGKLKFSNTGTKTFQAGTTQIKNNSSTCFDASGATSVVCTGATIQFSGNGAQTIPALPVGSSYEALTTSGARGANSITLVNGGTINISGIFTPGATFTTGGYIKTNNTINFNGTVNQSIPMPATGLYNDIQINCTGAVGASLVAAVSATNVVGSVTVQSGTLNNGGFAMVGNAAKTFQVNNGAFFVLTGSSAMPSVFGTTTLQPTSTVDFNGSGAQTIPAKNFGHVTSSNTGARTLVNGGIIGIAGTFTPGTNVYTVTNNTINFNGTVNQSVPMPAGTALYNNIQINCTGSSGATLAADVNTTNTAGNITVQTGTLDNGGFAIAGNAGKTFQVNNGATFILSGTTSAMPAGFTVTTLQATSTVNFAGTGAQTITALNYGNLTSSSTGARTLAAAGTVGVATTFTPGTNVYTITSSTVNFNGTVAQFIPAFSFTNVQLNNAMGASLTGNIDLTGVCTIGAGTLTTTGFNLTLLSTATPTMASIDAIPVGAGITGNIIIQRYTPASLNANDWRFICAPVDDATVTLADWGDDFATSGFNGATCDPSNCSGGCAATCNTPSIYWYDESQAGDLDANGYTAPGDISDPIVEGRGYWVYVGPSPVTFAVTGNPYQQARSLEVTYNNSGDINNDGWCLVANPYPCTIDWDAATDGTHWTKTNMGDETHVYNSGTASYADYSTSMGGVNGGTRYIASQQAFWVKADGGGVPALTARELVKASAQNPTFFKAINSPNVSQQPVAFKDFPVLPNITKQDVLKLTASGSGHNDEILIGFRQGASNNYDPKFDCWKLASPDPGVHYFASVLSNNKDLSINALPPLTGDISVPLRMKVPVTGTYKISRDSTLMIPMSSCLVLEDKKTGSMIDLRATVSYTFTISDTTVAPRFILHIYSPVTKKAIGTTCASSSNGMAIAKGIGAGPWNYIWKNSAGVTVKTTLASATADTLFNCMAGTYSVNVTGSVCGAVNDTVVVLGPAVLAAALSQTDVACFGGNNGAVTVVPTGGTAAYSFLWGTGKTTASITGLTFGTYSVTITDGHGCTATASTVITQPQLLSKTSNQSDVSCFNGNNGSASVNVGGGTLPYSYLWSNLQTSPAIMNLYMGNYSVSITDAAGCTATASFTISQPTLLSNTVSATAVSCHGFSDGSASIFVAGGAGGYSFIWGIGQTTASITNVSAGNFDVTVTDGNGCVSSGTVTVSQPAAVVAAFTASTYTVDLATGNSVTFANGSSGASSYQWNFGDASPLDNSANPSHSYTATGTYLVILTSSDNGCSNSTSKNVVVINSNPTVLSENDPSSNVSVVYDKGDIYLQFSFSSETMVDISVYNMMGQQIFTQNDLQVRDSRVKLEFPSSAAGIYIAISEIRDALISKKIIIPIR